jgi:glycosyltransferase involved in cell wall biosynthesis
VRILFAHQNFPGQYRHLLDWLRQDSGNEITFLTERANEPAAGIRKVVYKPARVPSPDIHQYLRLLESSVLRGQAVAREALKLRAVGFRPDIMIGHNAWGEILYLKDVFADAPLLGYFEYFRRPAGGVLGFDPEYPPDIDTRLRHRTLNAVDLLGLDAADWGQTATQWQKSQLPRVYHDRITVVHEGVDTRRVAPDASAQLVVDGVQLTRSDDVITYVARNLEPYRGFHVFMRALPAILSRCPRAHVVIVGGDGVSYSPGLPKGETYRTRMLAEVAHMIDSDRVHFLGWVPYSRYLQVLKVSAAHVYLTYPFVLSWSMLEAMSAGCLVIGSATAPVTEVIRDRDNGLLVDFFSQEQLVDRVDEALTRSVDVDSMRERARQTIIERFDLATKALPAQMRLIGEVVAGRS